jgi:lipopolysaccharide/colanic/teichoic acid biosynthesis glycosyltransferase
VPGRLYPIAKRALDVTVASAALVATAPILAAAAGAVRVTLGKPVLFRHLRPGKDGRPFEIYKLRTMRAARAGEASESDADRLTPLGRFLRSTSIDELPELLNVLRGELSLVGPRPLLMEYLERYTPEQARRHDVMPGITGWAQVEVRNAADWDTKLALDLWYVEHRSLWLDLVILARTVGKVLARSDISAPGHATMPIYGGGGRSGVAAGENKTPDHTKS